MNITIFSQKIRIEIVLLIMIIGGFVGVTFWCNCKGNIYEGLTALTGSNLDEEDNNAGCGCVNKQDRRVIGNAPMYSDFSK